MSSFGEYLEKHQPLVYKSFLNAYHHDRLPHALLLVGESGTPLKETALYLAKSILCDDPSPLACEKCRSCERVAHGTYADFSFLDGEANSIKKEDVQEVVDKFSRTPIETKGKMIYVIHLVENLNENTINSILKFLEEPQPNTFAILTTQNESKILPTIISRCEKMRMLLVDKKEVIEESLALGVDRVDAEILSYFSSSPELIQIEAENEDYIYAKSLFAETLNLLNRPRNAAIFAFESKIIDSEPDKRAAKYYLDMLSVAFKDLVAIRNKQPILFSQYATLLEPLSTSLPHIEESLAEILRVRSELDLNINVTLILEHVAVYLTQTEVTR